jgi:hypothetical protein
MVNHKAKYFSPTIVLLIFLSHFSVFSQTDSTYIITEEVLEDLLQEPAEEGDNSELYEILENLMLNPVNINQAGIDDLLSLPEMDLSSAQLIIEHRKKYGDFFSIYELNAVQNLNPDLIRKIYPFITVTQQEIKYIETKSALENFIGSTNIILRSRFANDIQTRRGFIEGRFEGTKPRVYNRLLARYQNNIQAGLLIEKDPGESLLNDFSSYHLALKNIGIIHSAVVMDYLLEFGQGLTLWSPYAFTKGADAIYPVKRKDKIIKPYTSSTEVNFFRGAAAAVNLNNFIVSGFYSNNTFDANIDSVQVKLHLHQ